MNELIIVGNGFDRAHGLHTDYSSYASWLIQELFKKDSLLYESSSKFNNTCQPYFSPWNNTRSFNNLSPDEFTTLFKNGIIRLDNKPSRTLRQPSNLEAVLFTNNDFLHNLLSNTFENHWLDIENFFYVQIRSAIDSKSSRNVINEKIEDINSAMEFLKSTLKFYLQSITQQFDVKSNINHYKAYQKILNSKLALNRRQLVVNYNYTEILSQYLSTGSERNSVINIHGTFHDENNKLVLGYGSIQDKWHKKILDENFPLAAKNLKYIQYSRLSSHDKLVQFLKERPFNLKILGHSCGESDSTTLNNIFNYSNLNRIEIYHYLREGENHDFSKDYEEKVFNIYRHRSENFQVLNFIPPTENHVMPQLI
jgi:hypothetical protein